MATDYGTKMKSGKDGSEVGQGFGEPQKRMKGAPKATNHSEHNEMMHKMMPPGYKGDCGY
jgi:hypothetical protein